MTTAVKVSDDLKQKKDCLRWDKCIVLSLAIGSWYPKGLERLADSLKHYCIPFKFWLNEYPPGSPTHQQHPYAFKYFGMKWARDNGYTHVLWVDTSIWFLRHPIEIFKLVDHNGFFVTTNDASIVHYTNDNCWSILKQDKQNFVGKSMYSAGLTGLKLTNPKASLFLNQMLKHSLDGSFVGPWSGPNIHRHDQSVGSILLNNMSISTSEDYYALAHFANSNEKNWSTSDFQNRYPEAIVVLRGM